jgi:hypothetical protein
MRVGQHRDSVNNWLKKKERERNVSIERTIVNEKRKCLKSGWCAESSLKHIRTYQFSKSRLLNHTLFLNAKDGSPNTRTENRST